MEINVFFNIFGKLAHPFLQLETIIQNFTENIQLIMQ